MIFTAFLMRRLDSELDLICSKTLQIIPRFLRTKEYDLTATKYMDSINWRGEPNVLKGF